MIELNFSNIEELIFYDTEAQKILPQGYFSVFEQWRISKKLPILSSIGRQAVLDLLNNLTNDDLEALEFYFQDTIILKKMNYSISNSFKFPLSEEALICNQLCEIYEFGYYSIYRDDEHLYITFWR